MLFFSSISNHRNLKTLAIAAAIASSAPLASAYMDIPIGIVAYASTGFEALNLSEGGYMEVCAEKNFASYTDESCSVRGSSGKSYNASVSAGDILYITTYVPYYDSFGYWYPTKNGRRFAFSKRSEMFQVGLTVRSSGKATHGAKIYYPGNQNKAYGSIDSNDQYFELGGQPGGDYVAYQAPKGNRAWKLGLLKDRSVFENSAPSASAPPIPSGNTGFISPVPGAYFNKKTQDGSAGVIYHDININVTEGTPVVACADGDATFIQSSTDGYLTSFGNNVKLVCDDGTTFRYCHLSAFNGVSGPIPSSKTKVKSGSTKNEIVGTRRVRKGDVIAYIGQTGNASAPHLHFEVRNSSGTRIDPTSVIAGLTR